MKVLIVNCYDEKQYNRGIFNGNKTDVPYICNKLKLIGIEIRVVKLVFHQADNYDDIINQIKVTEPDYICYSIAEIDSLTMLKPEFYLDYVKRLSKRIRQLKISVQPKQIGFGTGFSIMPELICNFLELDYGIVDDGEVNIVNLINYFLHNQSFSNLPQIITQDQSRLIKSKLERAERVQEVYTDGDILYPTDNITINGYCTHECIYCPKKKCFNNKLYESNIENLINYVERIQPNEFDIDYRINDCAINNSKETSIKFFRGLIDKKIIRRWEAFLHPSNINKEYILLLKESGCVNINLRVDAVETTILQSLKRPFSREDIDTALKIIIDGGIPFKVHITLGAPKDNDYLIEKTLEYLESKKISNVQFNIGIRIFPDTVLHEISILEGVLRRDESLLYPRFYFSNDVTNRGVNIIKRFKQRNPNWDFIDIDKLGKLIRERDSWLF